MHVFHTTTCLQELLGQEHFGSRRRSNPSRSLPSSRNCASPAGQLILLVHFLQRRPVPVRRRPVPVWRRLAQQLSVEDVAECKSKIWRHEHTQSRRVVVLARRDGPMRWHRHKGEREGRAEHGDHARPIQAGCASVVWASLEEARKRGGKYGRSEYAAARRVQERDV